MFQARVENGNDREAETNPARASGDEFRSDSERQLIAEMVGHELREPINAILSFLNVTIQGRLGSLTDIQSEFLKSTETAARRLERRIDDVQIALLGGDALKLKCSWINLNNRVLAACRELEWAAEKYDVIVVPYLEQSSRNPGVWADPDRLDQVLINLLENAIRYAASGSEVRIRTTFKDQGAWSVIVGNVVDEALTENPARWFEAGNRASHAGDRSRPGLGLGLTIARHLILAHDGKIWADASDRQVRIGFALPHRSRGRRSDTA